MNFGQEKQLIRLVEVIALSALLRANPSKRVENKLKNYAFPGEIQLDKDEDPLYYSNEELL